MISDHGQEFINVILVLLCIIWIFKITYHFGYLKAIGRIKELNFFSFSFKLGNILKVFVILLPVFFLKKNYGDGYIKRQEKRLRLSTYVLWLMIAVTIYYLFHYPPSN